MIHSCERFSFPKIQIYKHAYVCLCICLCWGMLFCHFVLWRYWLWYFGNNNYLIYFCFIKTWKKFPFCFSITIQLFIFLLCHVFSEKQQMILIGTNIILRKRVRVAFISTNNFTTFSFAFLRCIHPSAIHYVLLLSSFYMPY